MKRKITFFLSFIFFSATYLCAQLNPVAQVIQTQQGLTHTNVIVKSIGYDPNLISPSSSANYDTLHFENIGNGEWELWYQSSDLGENTIYLEYFDNGPIPGFPEAKYATIKYLTDRSIVETQNDFFISDGTTQNLNVLANDNTSAGASLDLHAISFIDGATASINPNNTIDFTIDASADRAFVQYVTKDANDVGNHGIVCVIKQNSHNGSVNASMHNKEKYKLHLDRSDYSLLSGPSNGTLVQLSSIVWEYEPDPDFDGSENISFTDSNSNQLDYSLQVFNKDLDAGFVRDDKVFTAINETIQFDAFANDLKSGYSVVDHSAELAHLGNGVFDYTPPTDFSGDQIFYYKVFTGLSFLTGNIYIHVDDQFPVNSVDYSFQILEDELLSLDYQPDFSSYDFNVISNPTNGTVSILNSQDQLASNCDVLTGEHRIIYEPNTSFSGTDEFEIEYCTSNGSCTILKIDVEVAAQTASDCVCYNSCIWSGDFNNDGIVNDLDFLVGNFYMGYSGLERPTVSTQWASQSGTDWNFSMNNLDVNQKHIDGDGDGHVSQADMAAHASNYGKYHNLLHDKAFILDDLPLIPVPRETQVDSGEVLHIDLILGSSSIPAIDVTGLGFQLNIDPGLMDSSSVKLTVYDDSWIGDNSTLSSNLIVPKDGQINLAISTLSNLSATGAGAIAELEFIVEEEIDGWRSKDGLIPMIINLNHAVYMNEDGDQYRLPDHTVTAQVKAGEELSTANSILMYPNPTTDQTQIESLNSAIKSIEVYDLSGRCLHKFKTNNLNTHTLSTNHLPDGLYLVKIYTDTESFVQKLKKVSL